MNNTARAVRANGIEHHVREWVGDAARTVLVLHGYLDHSASFAHVAEALWAGGERRVIAPDFRGHGRSGWVPEGGYYHFPDYVADVDALLDALAPAATGPVSVLAHSMGGTVATMYAGTRPERVRALVLAEGTGPLALPPDSAPDRVERWLDEAPRARSRGAKKMDSLADAVARLRGTHGGAVPEGALEEAAREATMPHPSGQGLAWRFDPLHQTTSPGRFEIDAFAAFARRVACPVLLVDAGSSGFRTPDFEAREGFFARRRKVVLEGAGHMMQWTRPVELAAAVDGFLREVGA